MGKLNLIIGPMYSGKSSMLISRYLRYKIANKKCIIIKFDRDKRYDDSKIVTHNLISYDAIPCGKLEQVDNIIQDYDVVCIDEVQFYPDSSIFCDKWANQGKIVEASGLNGDFKRQPFEQISKLIPLADKIDHLVAVDRESGEDAPFTTRLSKEKEQIIIGGIECYQAMTRQNHMKFINSDNFLYLER